MFRLLEKKPRYSGTDTGDGIGKIVTQLYIFTFVTLGIVLGIAIIVGCVTGIIWDIFQMWKAAH
jgi:hypothetical protein